MLGSDHKAGLDVLEETTKRVPSHELHARLLGRAHRPASGYILLKAGLITVKRLNVAWRLTNNQVKFPQYPQLALRLLMILHLSNEAA